MTEDFQRVCEEDSQNYPNPFNPITTISFSLPVTNGASQPVDRTFYDIHGRRVRALIDSELEAGHHVIAWNGRDERSRPVSSRIYLYTPKAGDEIYARKMRILKLETRYSFWCSSLCKLGGEDIRM